MISVTNIVISDPLNAPQMPTRVGSVESAPVRKFQLKAVRILPADDRRSYAAAASGAAFSLILPLAIRSRLLSVGSHNSVVLPSSDGSLRKASRTRTQAPSEISLAQIGRAHV